MSVNLAVLFGSSVLKSKTGAIVSLESLEGKVVALYFSAHWCGPCRRFTPALVEKYTEILAAGHAFEVIFVSSDQDQAAFDEYYADMPWFCLDFADREKKSFLNEHFEVEGIPTLVLLNGKGELLSKEGTELILSAPFDKLEEYEVKRAEAAEWTERERMIVETEKRMYRDDYITALPQNIKTSHHTEILSKVVDLEETFSCGICFQDTGSTVYRHVESLFNAHPKCCLEKDSSKPAFSILSTILDSATLKNKQGEVVSVESLKGKTVGLYISAHWCGPCRAFTPTLVEKYLEINATSSTDSNNKPFEVIFMSWDETAEDQSKYYAEMPWLEADFVFEKSRGQFISELYGVRGIPTLLLFDENGCFLTDNGREALFSTPFTELSLFESKQRAIVALEATRVMTLASEVTIPQHEHVLVKTQKAYGHGQFGCDICHQGGEGWNYHCDECQYDAHLDCALKALIECNNEVSTTEEVRDTSEPDVVSEEVVEGDVTTTATTTTEVEMEWVCEGDVCTRKPKQQV